MLEFFLIVLVLGICGLIFGKADTKRDILNQVGLDLSDSAHENMKIKEFEKYCKRAMINATEKVYTEYYNIQDCNESRFLDLLKSVLNEAIWGEERNNLAYLRVKDHYVRHAWEIVDRRIRSIKENRNDGFIYNNQIITKGNVKKYVNALWAKYNLPWPEKWNKLDKA